MTDVLLMFAVVAGGVALFGVAKWLERLSHRAGLAHLIGAVFMLVAGSASLLNGYHFLSVIFAVQAVIFLYHAYWCYLEARRIDRTSGSR